MIITILRKPLEGTVAENTLKNGCGGINIDATRIGGGGSRQATAGNRTVGWGVQKGGCSYEKGTGVTFTNQGRWPANFILTHLEGCVSQDGDGDWACVEGCPVQRMDKQTGILRSGKDVNPTASKVSGFFGQTDNYYSAKSNYGDEGGASRFVKQFKKENN